jgi:ERF superfamily
MEKSTSLINLSKALVTFHVKVDRVKKDATNPFFKSKYASLSNILEAINEPLIESGLCFSQFPTDENGLTTILMHSESGEFLQSTYVMKPVKDDPQGRGSVITYQRRYALAAVLGLNIDDDDDANTATHGGATPAKAEKQANDDKPWLNKTNKDGSITETWGKVVKALEGGKYTLASVMAKYKVSKENQAELKKINNQQPA